MRPSGRSRIFKHFYFAYETHLPAVEELKARRESGRLRIISGSGLVLFDSSQAFVGGTGTVEPKSAELPDQVYQDIAAHGFADVTVGDAASPDGVGYVTTYRRGDDPNTFLVEWKYGFQRLARNLAALRRQILLDLIPSAVVAILLAWFVSRLLARPIRNLVQSLGKVTQGDYSVEVPVDGRNDEVGEMLRAFNQMTRELRSREERKIPQPPPTAAVESEGRGGPAITATILFADIRSFVGLCESLSAEEVTTLLNDYFTSMVEVIDRHGGEVDKFIGDAILAVFYDEEGTNGRGPLDAVFCALEMRGVLVTFNEKRVAAGKNAIEIGVGITYGEVISGPVGSPNRRDFTVIGDIVNLANRIEQRSKGGRHTKIVFSGPVEAKVRGLLECEAMTEEVVRGKEEPVAVFELVRVRSLDSLVSNLLATDVALRGRSAEILFATELRWGRS